MKALIRRMLLPLLAGFTLLLPPENARSVCAFILCVCVPVLDCALSRERLPAHPHCESAIRGLTVFLGLLPGCAILAGWHGLFAALLAGCIAPLLSRTMRARSETAFVPLLARAPLWLRCAVRALFRPGRARLNAFLALLCAGACLSCGLNVLISPLRGAGEAALPAGRATQAQAMIADYEGALICVDNDALPAFGALLPRRLGETLSLRAGDAFMLESDGLKARCVVYDLTDAQSGAFVLLSPAYYEELFGKAPALELAEAVFDAPRAQSLLPRALRLSAWLIALALLVAVACGRALPRDPALEALREQGFSSSRLRALRLCDTLLPALLGAVFGMAIAYCLSPALVRAAESDTVLLARAPMLLTTLAGGCAALLAHGASVKG